MKIVIIGAGIGGLSAYHALRKHLSEGSPPVTIKIYESHLSPASTSSTIGGSLGLSPNGLRAISSVAPDAVDSIQRRGFRSAIMTFRNSTGTLLGRYWNGREERYGYGQVMLPRAIVHESLIQGIPEDIVEWGRNVLSVRETEDDIELELQDGSTGHADLVIGADGVRSIDREAIFGEKYNAEYEGCTAVGGFLPLSSLSSGLREGLEKDPITLTFGSQCIFGYSLTGGEESSQQLTWWSTYETAQPLGRDTPASEILLQLIARHGSWKSPYDSPDAPVFESITSLGCSVGSSSYRTTTSQNNTLILPRYIVPRLPSWSSPSGKMLLLGDAAHAMPPDAGQGVSCAAEDAAFPLLEKFEMGEVLRRTAKSYEEVRIGRVGMILDIAKRRGDSKKLKSWWEERVRDWIMWLICKLPESLNDKLFGYDAEAEVAKYIKALHK